MNCGPPGSTVHGISQARMLEWAAISFSKGSSRPRDWTAFQADSLLLNHQGFLYKYHVILCVFELYKNNVILCVAFLTLNCWFKIIFLKLIHIVVCGCTWFIFCVIYYSVMKTYCIYLLSDKREFELFTNYLLLQSMILSIFFCFSPDTTVLNFLIFM